jgi:ABC-type sulfate/molybdate transport systems ATPase subunit
VAGRAPVGLAVVGARVGRRPYPVVATIDVAPGEVVALLGPSGAGKSTILAAVAGLVELAGGGIWFAGRALSLGPGDGVRRSFTRPLRDRGVGLVGQQLGIFPHLTVADTIGYGLAEGRRHPRVGELADALGLGPLLGERPGQLSGGQQVRVALARALAPAPPIVLVDEALAALDAPRRAEVARLLRADVRQRRPCCLLVTHALADAQRWADRVAVVSQGQVVQVGPPLDVVAEPSSTDVARLVGYSAVVPADAVARVPGAHWPEGTAAIALHPMATAMAGASDVGRGTGSAVGTLRGTIAEVYPSGTQWVAAVTVLGGGQVPVTLGGSLDRRPGDPVEVAIVRAPCFDAAGRLVGSALPRDPVAAVGFAEGVAATGRGRRGVADVG